MEMVMSNGFCEMTADEAQNIMGGFIIAVVAVGTATITITSGHVVGAIATAYAAGKVVGEIKKTFF